MAILRSLGLTWAKHPEVDSHWLRPAHWRSEAAVTHPHKGMTAADAQPPGVSFCTTCYNRLSFLRQTLPRNLAALDPRDEIVLLDYGSTDGLGHWVRTALLPVLADGRLQYFRAEMRRWHVSRAKNIACRRVINIGGFLNDQAARIWHPPYHESPAALTALAV